jgi:membrane fusion protein (multidrug efflux system)
MKFMIKTNLFVALCTMVMMGCTPDGTEDKPEKPPLPIAQVQTVELHISEIQETISAYGTVLPWPDKLQTVSVPYTCRIEKILVNEGQSFQKGDVMLLLKPADDANLQLAQAKEELKAAKQEQSLVQERLKLKLATKMELATALLRTDQAKVMITNLADRGVNQNHQLRAEHAGIVHLLSVQQNQIVPAGNPILQWVDKNQWVVRVGVEPEDKERLQLNQEVLLTPTNKPNSLPIKGRIATITNQIDPVTRLLTVYIKPESNQDLLINDYMDAKIILATATTLVAPRQALLPNGKAYRLFTIEKGHAVLHQVQVGLENDTQAEVIASDLIDKDEIVVLGNYELEDGMAVEVNKP